MAQLRKQDTGEYPVTIEEFKRRFRNVSFGIKIPFAEFGYDVVFDAPKPTPSETQGVRELPPIKTVKGHWEQRWEVFELPPEVIAANQEEKKRREVEEALRRLQEIDREKIQALTEALLSSNKEGLLTLEAESATIAKILANNNLP